MNKYHPFFYRRVRRFCELTVRIVSLATGVSENRIAQIEVGRREPNPTEARLIESFLRDKLRIVFETDGPPPSWMRTHDDQKEKREVLSLGAGRDE